MKRQATLKLRWHERAGLSALSGVAALAAAMAGCAAPSGGRHDKPPLPPVSASRSTPPFMQPKQGVQGLAKNGPKPSNPAEALKHDKDQQAQIIKKFDERAAEEDLRVARQCWQRGDAEGCRTALRRLLQRKPDHRDGVLLLAEVQLLDEQPGEAIEPLARLCQKHPTDPEIRHVMALVLDAAGQPQKALVFYRQAAELAPDEVVFQASLELAEYERDRRQRGSANLASAARPNDDPGDSLRKTTVRVSPKEPAVGTAAPRAGDNAPPAANDVALAKQPAQGAAKEPSAAALNATQSSDAPESQQPEPQRDEPAMRLKLGAGNAASLNVVRVSGQDLPSQPDEPARSIQAVKASPAASRPFERAPEKASDPASKSKRPALAAAPKSSQQAPVDARDLLQQADDALRQGQPDRAALLLRQAAKSEPDDDKIVMTGAVLALRYNQPALAEDLLDEGVRRFPDSARLFRTLGTARYRLGRFGDAEKALSRALALDNTSALAYFLMASTLEKLGRKAEAQQHFRQAYALDPSLAQRR
ncbi:MAG: tetratricopeptide repeat protein [Planctomycetia bacterium]|nr:tetratricopeptide repeat protein [Planctomycetia bacterium]